MSERLQVQIVSDFLCPFCKVACERAAWLESEFDAEIEWLPWDLHPEYPAEGIPRSELVAKYGAEHFASVAQMFEDCGFAYAPHPERVPNTHLALELGELARAAGLHSEYHGAVMVGMWEQELDVADPAVLILDEATSSLDIPSERLVQRALRTVLADRTALIIAHRLSTIADADTILVLDQGRLAESGSHSALLRADGLYAEMWARQQNEREELGVAAE
jgi:2-hydroxychromene-2-carboxylate isomerase